MRPSLISTFTAKVRSSACIVCLLSSCCFRFFFIMLPPHTTQVGFSKLKMESGGLTSTQCQCHTRFLLNSRQHAEPFLRLDEFFTVLRLLSFALTARPPSAEEIAVLSECVFRAVFVAARLCCIRAGPACHGFFRALHLACTHTLCSGATFQRSVRLALTPRRL